MPNLNIPVSEELLRAVNMAALKAGLNQKQFVVKVLEEVVNDGPRTKGDGVEADVPMRESGVPKSGSEGREPRNRIDRVPETGSPKVRRDVGHTHDAKTCRVYGCLQCRVAGVKDELRGIA